MIKKSPSYTFSRQLNCNSSGLRFYCGLTPASSQASHSHLFTPLSSQLEVRKLLGWDKDNLMGQKRKKITMMINIMIKIYKTGDAQSNCSLFANQCPVRSWAASPGQLPPHLNAEQDVLLDRVSLWSVGVSRPTVSPPKFLWPSKAFALAGWKKLKQLLNILLNKWKSNVIPTATSREWSID